MMLITNFKINYSLDGMLLKKALKTTNFYIFKDRDDLRG